jgi:putative membrane-bound dehydrogenase-like protein
MSSKLSPCCVALSLLCLLASITQAQRCTIPGFKVDLIFDTDQIEHPSVVTCDDQGNLFVGEDPMDMRGPTTKEFDRILFVQFNSDGSVRRKTVFAEGLSAVFGLVWHNDALYVMHAPHYTMFKDTDGDGVADVRQDLADGFGPPAGIFGFNDHIVTGTRLGLDGYIYVSVGDKGIQKATGNDGTSITLEGGGVVRMKPDGTELEVVSCGTRNHLDVAMDSLDNIFTYDNTDDGLGWWTRFTHHIPTGYYGYPYDYHPHAERHLPRISEHGGGSPVGAACYRDDVWPEVFRDAAFHCEWGKGKVQVFYPKPDGATFTAEMEDFLVPESGSDFRPQDLCFSPDGRHMYVADWNFGGWTQDKKTGRLYRVTYVGEGANRELAPLQAESATTEALGEALNSTSYSRRVAAQWELSRRATEGVSLLKQVIGDSSRPAHAKIHALWSLNAAIDITPGLDPTSTWIAAMNDPDPNVRSQAARAIGTRHATQRWATFSTTENQWAPTAVDRRMTSSPVLFATLLEHVAKDQDPRVRMQCAITLGRMGHAKAAESLFKTINDSDLFTRFAKTQAVRSIGHWEPALQTIRSENADIAGGTLLAATGVYDVTAIKTLGVALQEGATTDIQAAAVNALSEVHRRGKPYETGWWGTRPAAGKPARPKDQDWKGTPIVESLLRQALLNPNRDVRLAAVVAQIEVQDPQALETIRTLAASDPEPTVREKVFAVLAAQKDDAATLILSDIANSSEQPEAMRKLALNALIRIGGGDAKTSLLEIAQSDATPPGLLTECLFGIESLNVEKAKEAVASLLGHRTPEVRAAAASCFVKVGGEETTPALIALLSDDSTDVRMAALSSLGRHGDPKAVPAMLELLPQPDLRATTIRALAPIRDRRALSAYLQGLVDRDPQLRTACGQTLAAMKGAIVNDLAALHKANELAPDVRRELGLLYSQPQPIRNWRILGNWSKEAPFPEFDRQTTPDFSAAVSIGKRNLKWKAIELSDADGKYDPNQLGDPTGNAWALAYAEIEAAQTTPVRWQLGSDDQARVWFNNDLVYEYLDNRGWSKDQGQGEARLQKGTNRIWFLSGNSSGPWQFSLAVGGPDPQLEFLYVDVPPALDLASFRKAATEGEGNATRGKKLFFDPQGIGCAKCHAVDKEGMANIGPNLLGVGGKYPKDELIRSVLEPSNRIASGYEMTIITTVEGETLQGIVKEENDDEIVFATTQAETIKIPKDLVDERVKSALSAMPNGLEKGMSLQDFADIIAYLQSIK